MKFVFLNIVVSFKQHISKTFAIALTSKNVEHIYMSKETSIISTYETT